ncbi:MAG: MFS transporter [Candidatus Tectomicrobia bacterium]|nr:MFS transporter [Candidatus Tectomicrobia bacterium]
MISSAHPSPAEAPSSFYYGWVIVGLAHVTLAFHVTTRFSFGIYQVPLIQEFGWSRGALGGAFALGLGTYAVLAPYTGSLLERHGPRAVMPWGCIVLGAAMAGSFFVSSLWHVYLFTGLLGGLGLSLSGFATHSSIMPRWFVRMRGRATGVALSGIGVGLLVLSPAIERAIAHWGWRAAYLWLGLAILLVIAPANFLLMRDNPEEKGQGPDGGPPRPPEALSAARGGRSGKGVREVFGTLRGDVRFWALVLLVFFIGLNANTLLSQLQLYLVDARYPTATALLNGLLFALLFGIGFGAMSSCYSALSGDCFEGPAYGVIVGFLEICYGLGGVVGPPLAGLMFDLTGNYYVPFSVVSLGMVGAIFLGLFLQRELDRRRAAA